MERVRSKGVTILAWSLIVISIFMLLQVGSYRRAYFFLTNTLLFAIIIYAVVFYVAAILAGISVLRLKEWARKLLLLIAIVGIVDMFIFLPLNHRVVKELVNTSEFVENLEKQYDSLSAEAKAKFAPTKQYYVRIATNATLDVGNVVMGIIEVIMVAYSLLLLFFFTRPRVREQFR